MDCHRRHGRRAARTHLLLPVRLQRLLQLRPGLRAHVRGFEDFGGTVVHPQHWPEDLDYAGKKIVVIGSGATAVTLIPALIKSGAGHVTMLQRSPTYIGSLPDVDPIAEQVNKFLPEKAAHVINRWKAILFSTAQYQLARRFPKYMRKTLLTMAERRLPEGYDVEKHFGPSYNPWDQRLCLAPNGDIFKAIRKGTADVVTDTIERFTTTGIKLASGDELDADIIITATGLNMQLLGGVVPTRNGETIDLPSLMTYKGLMFSGIPNFAITFGYTNASWTLKADLVSEFVCRVLNYMDANGFDMSCPNIRGAASTSCRSWTSPRATSSVRCTSCRSPARRPRGDSSRTTFSTSG